MKQNDIIITENRNVCTNKDLDYTFIELFKSDDINDYFEIAPNINEFKNIKDVDIFILQFPDDVSFSYGKIFRIKDNKFIHNSSTVDGSSGSPIIIKYENKFYVIGLHIGGIKDKKNKDLIVYNLGCPFNLILKTIKYHHNRIVMFGLDGAGKTTLLYQLKLGMMQKTFPTIGFNVETIKYNGLNLTIWDVGGVDKVRLLWKYYLQETDGVIFVIDSWDKDRFCEAIEELEKLLAEEELRDCCFLIFFNKLDSKQAASIDVIEKKLLKLNFGYRKWKIQGSSVLSGYGLKEGFDWMTSVLKT